MVQYMNGFVTQPILIKLLVGLALDTGPGDVCIINSQAATDLNLSPPSTPTAH